VTRPAPRTGKNPRVIGIPRELGKASAHERSVRTARPFDNPRTIPSPTQLERSRTGRKASTVLLLPPPSRLAKVILLLPQIARSGVERVSIAGDLLRLRHLG
jgi:hypothetical protein